MAVELEYSINLKYECNVSISESGESKNIF